MAKDRSQKNSDRNGGSGKRKNATEAGSKRREKVARRESFESVVEVDKDQSSSEGDSVHEDPHSKEEGSECAENAGSQQPVNTSLSARRIKATWPLISTSGRREILRVIDSEVLPTLHSIHGEKTKQEFQLVHRSLLRKLERKLVKVPVPPSTRKSHYEWETLHHQNTRLEATLAPMLEQNTHLEQEIAREARLLAQDKKYLKTLETNSKSQIQAVQKLNKKAQNIYRVTQRPSHESNTHIADSIDDVNLLQPAKTSLLDQDPEGDLGDQDTPLDEQLSKTNQPSKPRKQFKLTPDNPLVPVLRDLSAQLIKIKTATNPLNQILQECARLEQEF